MAAMLVSRLRCMLLLALALLTRQGGGAFWPSRLPGGNVIVQALKAQGDHVRRRMSGRVYLGVEPHQPVPFSSRQMAAVRALEAERADRLFDDPLSVLLAGQEAMNQARTRAAAAAKPSQGVGRKIACRTRYFDDFLLDCSSSPTPHGDIRLFYILGAGMDTRAWRLGLNGTVVEVDTADVIGAKDVLLKRHTGQGQGRVALKASGGRVGVAADLGTQQWLGVVRQRAEGGPGQGPPVAVVMEGLTMYLTPTQVEGLMAEVAMLGGPGSRVGISLVDTRSLADAQASASPLRQAWQWGCDEDKCTSFFEQALAKGGGRWRVEHVVRVGKAGGYPAGANYGCWRDMSRWKRKGKTLYVIARRVE